MNVLQRALNAIRQAVMPTAWAPTAPPGQPGGSPSVTPARTTPIATPRAPIVGQIPAGGFALGGTQPTFLTQAPPASPIGAVLAPIRRVVDTITPTLVGRAQAEEFGIPSPTRIVDAPPSQPDTITPERRNITPVPPAPTLPGDFQTRTAVLPQAPTLAPGTFQGQAPAPAGPATRAPIMTPGTAPTPAMTPPAPFMMGGGGDREAIIGGGINIPTEAPLPPARVLPGDLGGQAPLGQFDAMIRSLQARQGLPSRFVQMPMEGASPFGFAGAQERAIRRLRDRELQRAF